MADQKPKSYRLQDKTIHQLEAVFDAMKEQDANVNWDACFTALMQSYESQAAAAEAERPQEERDFRALLTRIGEAYKSALVAIAAADDRAAQDYAKRLSSAETAVSSLKEKAAAAQETAKRYEAEVQTLTQEVEQLEKELAATNRRADAAEASLNEVRDAKNLLAEQYAKARADLDNLDGLTKAAAERDALKVSIEEIRRQAELDKREAIISERETSAAALDKLRKEYAAILGKIAPASGAAAADPEAAAAEKPKKAPAKKAAPKKTATAKK